MPPLFLGNAPNIYDGNLTAPDEIFGEGGNDTLRGLGGNDYLDGGEDEDDLFGGTEDDTLVGRNGEDDLYGEDGNDSLFGSEGNDRVFGGVGNDIMSGESGADHLEGGDGNDTLFGEEGDDTLLGGVGNDFMVGGEGSDAFYGGTGDNLVSYLDSPTGLVIDLLLPNRNTGEATGDSYQSITAVYGTQFSDDISGTDGNEILEGFGGDNTLRGRGGDDALYGGEGNDVLVGGTGRDTLSGPAAYIGGETGNDAFVFDAPPKKSNADIISHFDPGIDEVWLDKDVFDLKLGSLQKKAFLADFGATKAKDGSDRIIVDTASMKCRYDPDGKGGQKAKLLFDIDTIPDHLGSGDFLVVS